MLRSYPDVSAYLPELSLLSLWRNGRGSHPPFVMGHTQIPRVDSGDEKVLHNESAVTMNQLSGNERAFVGGQK